jgi:hypothetical protein
MRALSFGEGPVKYNKAFIAAVYAVSHVGDEATAEAVFNKLFGTDVSVATSADTSKERLHNLLVDKVGQYLYWCDIYSANHDVGRPILGGANRVSWIKSFRAASGVGLKQAVDAHDFIRDNPSICA